MNSRLVLLLTATAATAAGAQVPVARDSARLDPVVVTAARKPEPLATASATVTVLEADELRGRGIVTVADALREVPGLAVVATGPMGAATSVFARGGNSNFMKVLVDGVAANEAGGAFDFAHLRLTNVERIEVVRGPASVLYGSDAVAGVIHVITRQGGAAGGSASARAGSRETADVRADLMGGGPVLWSAGAAREGTRGIYDLNNRYRNGDLSASLALSLHGGMSTRLTARYGDARYAFPTTGSGAPTDSNAYTSEKRTVLGVEAGRPLARWLDMRATAGWNRIERGSGNAPDSPGDTAGFYSSSEATANRGHADLRLIASHAPLGDVTIGVERGWEGERSTGRSRFASYPEGTTRFDERRGNRALVMQVAATPGSSVRLTAGGRVDDNDRFGTFRTWRASGAWTPLPPVALRASAGTAFREPSFGETFSTAFTTGNPTLAPERAKSWEVGATLLPARAVRLGATWFDQRFDNLIQYMARPFGSTLPNFLNLAAASARGLELEGEVAHHALFARLAGTALRTRVLEAGTGAGGTFVKGEPLLRRPARSGSATVGYRARHSVSLTALHTGARSDRDFSAFPARPVTLAPFTRLDASVALDAGRLLRGSHVTLRGENVANKRYENVYGFRTPGRILLAGVAIER